MILQVESTIIVSPYHVLLFVLLALILVCYILRKVLKRQRDKIEGPFESTKERMTLSQLGQRLPRTRILAASVLIIVTISSILVVGQLPVHRTDIVHSDPEGDVTDPDIDIIQIKSYLNGTDLFLKLTVAGKIVETSNEIAYQYRLVIITKGLAADSDAAIYRITFENGSVVGHSGYGYVKEDTLTLVFSIYALGSVSYMVGLEGVAQSYYEVDQTQPDRDGTIARLLS